MAYYRGPAGPAGRPGKYLFSKVKKNDSHLTLSMACFVETEIVNKILSKSFYNCLFIIDNELATEVTNGKLTSNEKKFSHSMTRTSYIMKRW